MPEKQFGTRCYENIAFHLAHIPDNEFSRRLLSCLLSSFVICTQASVGRVAHSQVHLSRSHRTPAGDRPWAGGNTKRSPRVDLPSGVLLPSTDTSTQQRDRSTGRWSQVWKEWTTYSPRLTHIPPTAEHQFSLPSLNSCVFREQHKSLNLPAH